MVGGAESGGLLAIHQVISTSGYYILKKNALEFVTNFCRPPERPHKHSKLFSASALMVSLPAALQEEVLSHLLQEPYIGDLMLVCKRWKDVLLTKHWVVQQPKVPPKLECWPALYEKPWEETPQKEILLGRALADRRKSVCQIFTSSPKEAFLLGFNNHIFNVGHGPTIAPCPGPLYVMEYKGGSRFRENTDPYYLPDAANFVTARPIEEIEREIAQRQLLLSQLMAGPFTGQINRPFSCHHA